jgi:predicted nucleic acid-binding Zn ribbon protein
MTRWLMDLDSKGMRPIAKQIVVLPVEAALVAEKAHAEALIDLGHELLNQRWGGTVGHSERENVKSPTRLVTCVNCGEGFWAVRTSSKVCSSTCRVSLWRKARGIVYNIRARKVEHICLGCGLPFKSARKDAVVCSERCGGRVKRGILTMPVYGG